MKVSKKIKDSKWCKFEGKVEFQIRPFKFSNFKLEDISKGLKEKFLYCVEDWKGITDDDGKTPLECTAENKELLYDYYNDVREFIFEQVQTLEERVNKAVKN